MGVFTLIELRDHLNETIETAINTGVNPEEIPVAFSPDTVPLDGLEEGVAPFLLEEAYLHTASANVKPIFLLSKLPATHPENFGRVNSVISFKGEGQA